jgi:large subunit ribosomal protein L15
MSVPYLMVRWQEQKMKLNEVKDNWGATKNAKRVGRGIGSGTGKTSGSGHKGQKARSGVSINGFEGGQMPIHRRLPKRGFNNIFRKNYAEVNLGRLQVAIDSGKLDATKQIDVSVLVTAGVISKARDGIRILANGTLTSKNVEIHAAGASNAAVLAVEKGGGKIVVPTAVAK